MSPSTTSMGDSTGVAATEPGQVTLPCPVQGGSQVGDGTSHFRVERWYLLKEISMSSLTTLSIHRKACHRGSRCTCRQIPPHTNVKVDIGRAPPHSNCIVEQDLAQAALAYVCRPDDHTAWALPPRSARRSSSFIKHSVCVEELAHWGFVRLVPVWLVINCTTQSCIISPFLFLFTFSFSKLVWI